MTKLIKTSNLLFVLGKTLTRNISPKFINVPFWTGPPWIASSTRESRGWRQLDHLLQGQRSPLMTGPLEPFVDLAIFTLLRRIYLRVSLVSRERKHEKKLFHASFRNDYLSRSSESSRGLFSVPVLGRGRRTTSPPAGSMASIIRL